MSRVLRAIGAVAALVALAVASVWVLDSVRKPESFTGTKCQKVVYALHNNTKAINATPSGARADVLAKQDGDLRAQLRDNKCIVDTSDNLIGDPEQELAPTAAPSSTAAPTPTSASTPAAGDDKSPTTANADKWKPHYYTLDKGKRADRDFGPGVKGGKKAVDGSKSEKAKTTKQISGEFKERMFRDPALLCANGGLILNGKDGGKKCVDKLVKSKSARDAYYAKVFDKIKSTKIEKRYAQYVESAVMVVPKDGVPRIVKIDTYRSSVYYVFVVKTETGKTYNFRLECGFQWDTGRKVAPRKYTPVTNTPYTPVMPCVSGSRDENGRCGRTPSGGGSGNPPGSHHPSPEPSTSTSTPPSCRNKQCETAVAEPTDRTTPSGTPTRNAETTASTESNPATVATATVKAKDTEKSEEQSTHTDDDGSQTNDQEVGNPDN